MKKKKRQPNLQLITKFPYKCQSCGKIRKCYLVHIDKNLTEFWCGSCCEEEEEFYKKLDCYGLERGSKVGKISFGDPYQQKEPDMQGLGDLGKL